MLDGLDGVPWDQLEHAYGNASDVPEILKRIAEGDGEAIGELFGNIWHQGTVYEATAHAVPFLVQLLEVEAVDRTALLQLLRCIATGSSYMDVHQTFAPHSARDSEETQRTIEKELRWVHAAREAVLAHAPALLRHLSEGPEDVRAAAAHTLASCCARIEIAEALRARLEAEESALVRASLLLALHPCAAIDRARAEHHLHDREALVRVAAALLLLSAEGDLTAAIETLKEALPNAHEALRRLPSSEGGDPIPWLLERVPEDEALHVALITAWMCADDPSVRADAVFASGMAMQRWRGVSAQLVPALARALQDADNDVRHWAARHLAAAGQATRAAADDLAALLEREPLRHNTPASCALRALADLEDARAAEVISAQLASKHVKDWNVLPIDALGPWAPSCLEPLLEALAFAPAGNTRIAVISALGRYGAAASRAIPRIIEELAEHPHIATRVLGDFGPLAHAALAPLRPYLRDEDAIVRVNTARAFWRIGSQAEIALPVLERALRNVDWATSDALEALSEMGPSAAALTPLLPPPFASENDWVSARAAIAHWRLVGDAEALMPTLLRHVVCSPRGFEVVACLGEMGPLAKAVVPRLRQDIEATTRAVQSGVLDQLANDDEAWCACCSEALLRITMSDRTQAR